MGLIPLDTPYPHPDTYTMQPSDQIMQLCRTANCSPDHLANVTVLYAGANSGITDAGLAHVPNLDMLDARGNSRITDAGLAHVPNLDMLDAGGSGITDAWSAIEQHAGGPMFKHIPDHQLFEVTA